MNNKRTAVITYDKSDFLSILENKATDITIISPDELTNYDLDLYDQFAVLGGGEEKPLLLEPHDRVVLEYQINKGKRVFAEYVASVGNVYFEPPSSTRYERLAYSSDRSDIPTLKVGDLIDDQCGNRLKPHSITCNKETPILQYTKSNGHDHVDLGNTVAENISDRALWFDDPDNLFVCSFRLSSFKQARFAPWEDVKKVIEFIVGWLLDQPVSLNDLDPIYQTGSNLHDSLEERVKNSAKKSIRWFENANILIEKGKKGAFEGFGTEVYPDGSQRVSYIRRADCIGETSLPYFLDYLLNDNEDSKAISNNLLDYIFENYVDREEGHLYGMMRWTNEAWGVCYQDDVARAIMPQLLKILYNENDDHLEDCISILKFLVKTTGTDGTRVFRTDNINLSVKEIKKLNSEPGNLASAHYNGFYYAVLLLAYKLTGIEEFKEVAIKGLTTMMTVYPETIREQSETQELSRLVLPLSYLFWITKNPVHREWLDKVVNDLEEFKDPSSGGYLEWDSGYQASMRNEMGTGESSLITQNGDPVVDLLYTNNWLPMSFIQAYWITGDEKFEQLWQKTSEFMTNSQIQSEVAEIDGAWARAYDVKRKEVFGTPADLGWGPWAIESGWSVAQISSGLFMGLLEEKLSKYYQ